LLDEDGDIYAAQDGVSGLQTIDYLDDIAALATFEVARGKGHGEPAPGAAHFVRC